METPDHALTAAGGRGGGAVRAFFGPPRTRAIVIGLVFVACWIAAAAKMHEVTGLDGLAVGIPLAAAPVPLVVSAFILLAKARPQPWQHLAFALSWGAGAGALAALYANSWSIEAIVDRSGEDQAELLGLTVVAPFVEELAKGAAVLLLLLFRRHWFRGPLDGLVLAATTAAGFAFTENILYFGRAFGEGSEEGDAAAQTAAIFLGRAILTPFAHPLFTASTGIALGLAVLARRRSHAVLAALGGYLVAVGLHSAWNGAAWKTTVEDDPAVMLAVYFLVMAPLLAGLFVLGAKLRRRQLNAVLTQLPWYVQAGWFTWNEPHVLASVADRGRQRRAALALHGKAGERAVRQYHWNATALAELRQRAARGRIPVDEFTTDERAFLDRLWALRASLGEVPSRTMPTPRWVPMPMYGWPRQHPATVAPAMPAPGTASAPMGPTGQVDPYAPPPAYAAPSFPAPHGMIPHGMIPQGMVPPGWGGPSAGPPRHAHAWPSKPSAASAGEPTGG